MFRLVHLLTAVAICVHATFGCCVHEVHGKGVASSEPAAGCCCELGGHAKGSQLTPAEPSESELSFTCRDDSSSPTPTKCAHANCLWPSPESQNEMGSLLLSTTVNAPWDFATSGTLVSSGGMDFPLLSHDLQLLAGPVRAHLLKCVLLI